MSAKTFHLVARAVAEADRRRADLRLVYACSSTIGFVTGAEVMPPSYGDPLADFGRTVLDQAAARVCAAVPDLVVTTDLRRGQPAGELLEQWERAQMTVVSAYGSNRVLGMLVGSVTLRPASHGSGPVAIVRTEQTTAPEDREHPVMVGLEGSNSSNEAGLAGLLLGSVGQALIAHADGPVCIVHRRER